MMNPSFKKVQQLKNQVDNIRSCLKDKNLRKAIPIPTIVVLGDQSSGKSSLLELLSGVDIPRSGGICTRVPLELRLRSTHHEAKQDTRDYATISMINNGKACEETISMQQVSGKITTYTELIAGQDKQISCDPIILTIYRQNSVDLTLIDLPGLVHFDKQDKNKAQMIKNLVTKYISTQETIMLNVVKSTQETANCASLSMSAEHDPANERTLVVLTFVDLYEDKQSMEFEQKYRAFNSDFEHVFLVRNRTNEQNQNNISLQQVQKEEMGFFQAANNMRNIEDCYKGSKQLAHKLAELQTKTMMRALPALERAIEDKFNSLTKEKELFPPILETAHECMNEISILISSLFVKLNKIRNGDIMNHNADYVFVDDSSLSSRTSSNSMNSSPNYANNNEFSWSSMKSENKNENLIDNEQKSCNSFCFGVPESDSFAYKFTSSNNKDKAMLNESGISDKSSSNSFVSSINGITDILEKFEQFAKEIEVMQPAATFVKPQFLNKLKKLTASAQGFCTLPHEIHPKISVVVVQNYIEKLKKPANALSDCVHKIIECIINDCINDICGDYAALQREILCTMNKILQSNKKNAESYINAIIRCEKTRPFTANHYYMTTVQKMEKACAEITHLQADKQAHDEPCKIIIISGRKGQNTVVNGAYVWQSDGTWFKHKNRMVALCKNDQWIILSKTIGGEFMRSVKDSNYNTSKSIANVKKWSVFEGKAKGYVMDSNIKVVAITDAANALVELCGDDTIAAIQNQDILLVKEGIKIAAYLKVVRKRLVDHICMLIYDNVVSIPMAPQTQTELHRMVLSRNKNIMRLMNVDKELMRKVRQNKRHLQQVTNAKQILDKIDNTFFV